MRSPGLAGLLLAAALASGPGLAQKGIYEKEMLIHPFLSDRYSQWLVGPIARIAGEDGIAAYLALRDDAAAQQFIDDFWREHSEIRGTFEERARFADDEFGENHQPGRRTDRGTIWILYGEPESREWEEFRDVSEPEVMMWQYPKKREEGLDGEKPKRAYRFARFRDSMVFYDSPSEEELRRRSRFRTPDSGGR